MILSKTAISFLCVLLLLSIFVANILKIIATDHNFYTENEDETVNMSMYLGRKYRKMTDTSENIVWFLQISDIHISIFRDPGRISQFQQFCDNTVKIIKPSVVLASGDLTDAKTKDNLGSSQVKTEWVYYHNIIKESGITDDTVWLDIRGNHDNFNVRSINSEENYFSNYSVQGLKHPKSYIHIINNNGISVGFVGVDACPDPGLRRPFNFIGILDVQEQNNLRKLEAEAEQKADHLVWFGHYPTSCILSVEEDTSRLNLRQLIGKSKKSQVYVCGHLHAMGGLVKEMYTRQKKGYLELELGDWKDNRMFRLIAIDHGLFSFTDQKHNSWPLVLITNPKHVKYMMPGREPLQLMLDSTHVRLLAFSDAHIDQVTVSFDGATWNLCENKEGPLYTCKWNPQLLKSTLQTLFVMVKDSNGREAIVDHRYTLDGSADSFYVTSRILLMLDAAYVFQFLFGILLVLNVVPLLIMRLQKRPPRVTNRLFRQAIRQTWMLSKVDKIFYPIVLFAIYMPVGPWIIGELIDGYIGAVFAWGILIKGTFIPEPFTYMYGSVQLMFVQIPLIFILASCLNTRLYQKNLRIFKKFLVNFPFIFLLSLQMLLAYFFWLEYGNMALIFGPLRSWSLVLSVIQWYKILNLPPDYCMKLIKLVEGGS